ncbi:asparagine synthase (glutamine-hydrolyzing) [Sphingomonas floccifaciens]|uniref:asparagine synthase (glutamine-hydrolyzing) n=1 Tax=Sphingomonas floccifaciens TaxID=1844115 RepID=A0ABW4NFD3_9SPHN
MSGTAGIFYPGTPKPVDPARIAMMLDALAHRGPDGAGVWTGSGVGLGHRRLATIDVAGSPQPMQAGALTITYDGAIFNFAELRAELQEKGARFATSGDAEVLLHGWHAWGAGLLDRLIGMFAFAIHDADANTLTLVRDRLGVKPLHYVELSDGAIAFASELKGLLVHPLVRREVDVRAVDDFMALGYVPDHACIVAGVKKLPAAGLLHLERGRPIPAPRRWWDIDFTTRATGSPRELEAELVDRLRSAVRCGMVADVPLGAFLSGDLDSSAIVALMAEASPRAVKTLSLGFEKAASAHAVAERFATDHRRGSPVQDDLSLIDNLVAAFDEPFAEPSAFATYRLSELARGSVAIALSGDGADEAFAGHRRYRLHAIEDSVRSLLPGEMRQTMFGTLGRLCPDADWMPRPLRAKSMFLSLADDGAAAYAHAVGMTTPEARDRLYGDAFRRSLGGYRAEDAVIATMRTAPARTALDAAQYTDMHHQLPGNVLTRVDRMSMINGLELRLPLLDHRLLEFAATLPDRLRIHGGQGKWLMRKAMVPWLPKDILYRPEPTPVSPISGWFRRDLASEAASLSKSPVLGAWFERATLDRLSEDHLAGRADHGLLLWQLLMLDRSVRRMFS